MGVDGPPLFFVIVVNLVVITTSFHFVRRQQRGTSGSVTPLRRGLIIIDGGQRGPVGSHHSHRRRIAPTNADVHCRTDFGPRDKKVRRAFHLSTRRCRTLAINSGNALDCGKAHFIDFMNRRWNCFLALGFFYRADDSGAPGEGVHAFSTIIVYKPSFNGISFGDTDYVPYVDAMGVDTALAGVFDKHKGKYAELEVGGPRARDVGGQPVLVDVAFSLYFTLVRPVDRLAHRFFPVW